jgi:RNA polymerase sigma factor, sigma-70 family
MGNDEAQLIRGVREGDHTAMETLFILHAQRAVRLAYLITRDWGTAEDAVQDSFIRAFRSINTFKDGRPFLPWFTKIVVNQARKTSLRRRADISISDVENIQDGTSLEENAIAGEDDKILLNAIYGLKEKYRLPVLLKYFSEFSESEVSSILKLPVSTVKSRLYTARRQLKDKLNDNWR